MRDRYTGTLAAIAAALVIAGGLVGCNTAERRAQVVGDTVFLPSSCSLFADTRSRPEDLPFVRFDGEYPEGWPDVARLPAETYLNPDGALAWDEDRRNGAEFIGICPGKPEDVAADWKKRITAAGWVVHRTYDDDGAAFPTGQAAGSTIFLADPPDERAAPGMMLTVWKHYNTDGWVLFEGSFSLSW
jgi:hypothetical protein